MPRVAPEYVPCLCLLASSPQLQQGDYLQAQENLTRCSTRCLAILRAARLLVSALLGLREPGKGH